MKGNKITEWDYELPTEPGLYAYCYGDVETLSNTGVAEFRRAKDSFLVDADGDTVKSYGDKCKWARLLIGSNAK